MMDTLLEQLSGDEVAALDWGNVAALDVE